MPMPPEPLTPPFLHSPDIVPPLLELASLESPTTALETEAHIINPVIPLPPIVNGTVEEEVDDDDDGSDKTEVPNRDAFEAGADMTPRIAAGREVEGEDISMQDVARCS